MSLVNVTSVGTVATRKTVYKDVDTRGMSQNFLSRFTYDYFGILRDLRLYKSAHGNSMEIYVDVDFEYFLNIRSIIFCYANLQIKYNISGSVLHMYIAYCLNSNNQSRALSLVTNFNALLKGVVNETVSEIAKDYKELKWE